MRKISLSIIVLFLFSSIEMYGQENLLPGYIVKSNGDTLRGYIDYRNWDRSPKSISFKSTSADSQYKYTPLDIKYFEVNGDLYRSAIVEIETSATNTNELDLTPLLKFRTDTAFLQTIVSGDKSLYYHKTSSGKEQFYIQNNDQLELLIYKRFMSNQNGVDAVAENKRYVSQLIAFMNDSAPFQSKIKKASYTKSSLTKLFLAYYGDKKIPTKFKMKAEKISLDISVLAGVSLASISFTGTVDPYLTNANFPQSVNFSGGVGFDLLFPRNRQKWSLSNELMFGSYKFEASYEDYKNANSYSITNSSVGNSLLKLNTLLRYRLVSAKAAIYINAGITNEFVIQETNKKTELSIFYSSSNTQTGQALETGKYRLGVLAGIGVKIKNYSFEARYEPNGGMSNTMGIDASINRAYFLLGYTFKRK